MVKVELVLSPQLTVTVQGPSLTPGSLKEPRLMPVDTFLTTVWPAVPGFTSGGTSLTAKTVVYSLETPVLSVMIPRTTRSVD